jgi:hypothetical protein
LCSSLEVFRVDFSTAPLISAASAGINRTDPEALGNSDHSTAHSQLKSTCSAWIPSLILEYAAPHLVTRYFAERSNLPSLDIAPLPVPVYAPSSCLFRNLSVANTHLQILASVGPLYRCPDFVLEPSSNIRVPDLTSSTGDIQHPLRSALMAW